MYEEVTYEEIMTRMLDRVRSEHPEVDTREGSLVYTAIAPCALELAIMYTELDRVLEEVFADTASLEYLEKRTSERGITQRLASNAIMQGEFDVEVPLGTRFSLGDLNYIVIDSEKSYLECETAGTEPNTVLGTLTPIDTVSGLTVAQITACIVPGEDDEDVEDLRARYFASLGTQSYGFNAQQYREVVDDMDGVGATKVIPIWNGGGTVKLVILDSNYNTPSEDQINIIQEAIDPSSSQGEGLGLAPIGHIVTVVGATEFPININCTFEYLDTYSWDSVKDGIYEALDSYFVKLAKSWETETVIVRVNQINTVLMSVQGILDVSGTTLNGSASNITIASDNIPVRGTVNGNV